MMTDGDAACLCILDTDGLHRIATASGNLKSTLLDHLENGLIGVPSCVWHEFEELYEEEAEALKPFLTTRIIMKRGYYVGAARIADNLNSGFPRGAYDDSVELFTAAIASAKGCRIITSLAQVSVYEAMGCEATDQETWVAEYALG
jgi:hypothetical protein